MNNDINEFGFERKATNIKSNEFYKNIQRGTVTRLKRTGKGSTAGHREKIATRQAIALDDFFASIRKAVSE